MIASLRISPVLFFYFQRFGVSGIREGGVELWLCVLRLWEAVVVVVVVCQGKKYLDKNNSFASHVTFAG